MGATGTVRAEAKRFAAEGARVFVISFDPADCELLASEATIAGWAAADPSDEDAAVGVPPGYQMCLYNSSTTRLRLGP